MKDKVKKCNHIYGYSIILGKENWDKDKPAIYVHDMKNIDKKNKSTVHKFVDCCPKCELKLYLTDQKDSLGILFCEPKLNEKKQ